MRFNRDGYVSCEEGFAESVPVKNLNVYFSRDLFDPKMNGQDLQSQGPPTEVKILFLPSIQVLVKEGI